MIIGVYAISFPLSVRPLALGQLVCDPPCALNQVCQNYSGVPECVCKAGFTGEDTCEGTNIETTLIAKTRKVGTVLIALSFFCVSGARYLDWASYMVLVFSGFVLCFSRFAFTIFNLRILVP